MDTWANEYHTFNLDHKFGNWRLIGKDSSIFLADTLPYIIETREIDLKEIAWKGKNFFPFYTGKNCPCCKGSRYIKANIDHPPLVIDGAPNPFDNRYLLIDGKHRMQKMLNNNMSRHLFNVLDYNDIKHLIYGSTS